jgi:class 3 adenylate cyclase
VSEVRSAEDRPTIAIVAGGEPGSPIHVHGRFYVGRECAGVDPAQRLVVDDPKVSRSHLELHVEPSGDVTAIDLSTNGTLLNGLRMDRAIPVDLADGDRLVLGDTELEFRAGRRDDDAPPGRPVTTLMEPGRMRMVLVAGDIIGSTSLAERWSSEAVAGVAHRLFTALGERLAVHRGMLSHLAGDAMLAVWDLGHDTQGADRAVAFALEAAALVERTAPDLPIRHADGSALAMGWGVSLGDVALSHLARGRSTVLGDPANVAFRLADFAGREGRPPVLVTGDVAALVKGPVSLGPESPLTVKGRETPVTVRALQPS